MPRIPRRGSGCCPRRRGHPCAPPATWLLCGVCTGRVALLQVMRLWRLPERKLFLIVQVPVGAVVKQLRRSKKEQKPEERGGGEGGGGEPLRKAEREGKQCWKTQRFMNIEQRGWRVGISAGCTEKPLTPFREVYFNSFFPFSFCC